MFKTKKAEQAPATDKDKGAQESAGSARPIRSFLLAVSVTAAILLLLTAAAAFFLQQQTQNSTAIKNSEFAAQSIARSIQQMVSANAEALRLLAGNPDIQSALRDNDQPRLMQLARQFQQQMDDVLQLRLLPRDYNETDSKSVAPITNASLDLLHRAAKSETVLPAEVHSPASGGKHIAMAIAVRDADAEVLGVIHIAISPLVLDRYFEALPDTAGTLVLQQVVGSKAIGLTGTASAESAQGAFAGDVAIAGSIWQVAYIPASGGSLLDLLLLPLILVVSIVPITVVAMVKTGQLKKALKFDQANIIRIVEAKLQGKVKHHLGNVCLLENKDTLAVLSQMPAASSGRTIAEKVVEHDAFGTAVADEDLADLDEMLSDSDTSQPAPKKVEVPAEIFREYDIRGIFGVNLNLEHAYLIGRAIGSLASEQGEKTMLVGRDGRLSSEDLNAALIRGLMASGQQVIDIGMVPTPVLYFATHFLSASSGVMVTGSHNPADHNGFKVVIKGETLNGDAIRSLHARIAASDFSSGEGSRDQQDIIPDYLSQVTEGIHLLTPMNIVIDCGNGVAGVAAKALFEQLGCSVTPMYCDVDGNFPNHHPDPGNPANLKDLIAAVTDNGADIGIAFDGDADRLGIVDSAGKVILPDRLLMLLATDVLLRNPGADVIYDVKSSKHLASHILSAGGRPIMWKSGHSLMKAKLKETGALLAGEFSGHIFFKERWYGFDDALYTAARLLEVISSDGRSSADIFAEVPDSPNTPELHVMLPEGIPFKVMEQLSDGKKFPNAKVINIDGMRVEYPGAWGLVRASNTTPSLVFRFEADNEQNLGKVQAIFRQVLGSVLPNTKLPF